MKLKPGQIWQHYKGDRYRVLHVGRNSETDDAYEVVVYQHVEFPENIWTQSQTRFLSTESWEGKTVPRFTFISDNEK